MKKLVRKHPLAIRWMHWINFPVLFVMIWSGMLIYWANDVFKIHLGNTVLFTFFPNSFYKGLNLSSRLAEGMAFHFLFMWIFFVNGLAYVTYTFFPANGAICSRTNIASKRPGSSSSTTCTSARQLRRRENSTPPKRSPIPASS